VNDSSSPRLYDLHGLRILSEIPLGRPTQDGPYDLAVSWSREGVPSEAPELRVLADASWDGGKGYRHVETAAGFRLRFRDVCDVLVTTDRRSLTVQLTPGADPAMIPILLEGNVLAVLLLLAGECVLHASAVRVGSRAVAFAGGSGAGKSTLAALCCAGGADFLTDDLLHVEWEAGVFRCLNGGREVRLRSQAASLATRFPDRPSQPTVDGRLAICLGSSSVLPARLAAVVIPAPARPGGAQIKRVTPLDGWTALMQAPRVLGLRDPALFRTAFETCSRLAQTVPVYRAEISTGPPYEPALGANLLAAVGLT
jgi:hypothetical protein